MATRPAGDDTTIYVVALAVGAGIVTATLVRHGPWGVAATLGLIVTAIAGRFLVVTTLLRVCAHGRLQREAGPGPTLSKNRWRIRPS